MTALKFAPIVDPTADFEVITPAIAKKYLARNVHNRPLRDQAVEAYVRDMASGSWQETGEPISFDINNALANGQHRLSAIVRSGRSMRMLVVRGLQPEAQGVMDSGRKRTSSDALSLEGIKNPTLVSAAARFALREPIMAPFGSAGAPIQNPTHTEIADFIEDHPEIHNAATAALHYYPAFSASPSVLVCCWMRFAAIDPKACTEFFYAIAEAATDGAGDPRRALFSRLLKAQQNKEKLSRTAQASLIVRTWNAWRSGATVRTIQVVGKHGEIAIPAVIR